MNDFPLVDPIPLPAPVWLLKALHVVTLSLHFVAVEMLLGGLLVAVALRMAGGALPNTAAAALARRLPVVMTYVINLGVPPLLFAQVLYGRALYTSSILMGAWWIAVIPLLTVCYFLLYGFAGRLEQNRPAVHLGLGAWLLAGVIAKIYSGNMTLMLRPEAWTAMYSQTAFGTMMPSGDPSIWPRFLFMLCGGVFVTGLWMLYLSGRGVFNAEAKNFLARTGGRLVMLMAVVEIFLALRVADALPAGVQNAIQANTLYAVAGYAWLAVMALSLALGAMANLGKRPETLLSYGGLLTAVLAMMTMTLYRDGIRDMTLLTKGFDVWNRVEVSNWSVIGIFLVLFVAALGVLGWLISVVARARKTMESAA